MGCTTSGSWLTYQSCTYKTSSRSYKPPSLLLVELQSLAQWCPDHLQHLCSFFHLVEEVARWPGPAADGAVVVIPTDLSLADPAPGDYRPVAKPSCVYRLWASARHKQLATLWLLAWCNDGCQMALLPMSSHSIHAISWRKLRRTVFSPRFVV